MRQQIMLQFLLPSQCYWVLFTPSKVSISALKFEPSSQLCLTQFCHTCAWYFWWHPILYYGRNYPNTLDCAFGLLFTELWVSHTNPCWIPSDITLVQTLLRSCWKNKPQVKPLDSTTFKHKMVKQIQDTNEACKTYDDLKSNINRMH